MVSISILLERRFNKPHTYEVGDMVTYSTFGGSRRCVIITNKEADIKNGQPGFDGITNDGEDVWGYDDQILSVQGK